MGLREMQLKNAMCIEDLRRMALRNVPRVFTDYMEAGSYSEHTRDANVTDMQAIKLRQRVLVDVSKRNLKTTVLGEELALPLALAPTGLAGMQHADGEILACKAAHAAGIQFCQSTMSICSLEDIRAEASKPWWFQLYVMRDRGFVKALIERAEKAGCTALFLTVDLPVNGQRHVDQKNGLSVPPRLTARTVLDVAMRPRWAWQILNGKRKTFANIDGHLGGPGFGGMTLGEWTFSQFDPTVSWKDVEWIRSLWKGKLVIKGILDAEDARECLKTGADAIVVSNHGGRQLDGAPSTIQALPKVAEAVGGQKEILIDSGIRTGQDIFRALALGANAAMIGRPFLYGLGAGGEAGVARAISILRGELDTTMILAGIDDVKKIDHRAIASELPGEFAQRN
jgi:L-lactate dehydrogenase (cytochrome)